MQKWHQRITSIENITFGLKPKKKSCDYGFFWRTFSFSKEKVEKRWRKGGEKVEKKRKTQHKTN